MSILGLRRQEKKVTADGQINRPEAQKLIEKAKLDGAISKRENREIRAIYERNLDKMDVGARYEFEALLGIAPKPARPIGLGVIGSVTGIDPSKFIDDTVFLGRDGVAKGSTEVPSYTRGYVATKTGPLRKNNGSTAPPSSVLTPAEAAALTATTPGKALDEAAKIFGAKVNGFEAMANSKEFYNPDAAYWWGKCHAWTWTALSKEINELVEVDGPTGQKGLWVAGQFLSKADLGNWMMATADTIATTDSRQLMKSNLSALDLLKGTTQFMMDTAGGGVVADVWNDKKRGTKEIWNQPFISADVTTTTLSGAPAAGLLAKAKAQGFEGTTVKLVNVVGTYAVEVTDDHEGAAGRSKKDWNMYVVADSEGRALTAYMADSGELNDIDGLPTESSDHMPEYFWKPTLNAMTDTLAGVRNETVENNKYGAEFKFFVGTVLKRGVSATQRTAFERELAALPAGAIDSATAARLASTYPTMANAYSPDQWKRAMQSRGLDAKAFGAAWPNP